MPLALLLFVAMLGSTPPYLERTPIMMTADSPFICPGCTATLVADVLEMFHDDRHYEDDAPGALFFLHLDAVDLMASVADLAADVLTAESAREHAKAVKRFLALRAEADALQAEFDAVEADPTYRTALQRQVEAKA